MSWFLDQKDRLPDLHPDMSEIMVHKIILIKCGGYRENSIRSKFIKTFSTEDYINAMEDLNTRTKIDRNWYKPPIDINSSGKPISRPNKPQEREYLKFPKYENASHLANTCTKKTRINDIEIENTEVTKETN
ncbi:hypothetical protein O181_007762 [Austropuccinia psidii MF-1]|uniref:Uncharacterized protein n=1 Tax=Austropuccinia psidii MF-1 TaxID=1389203 RepID=A0A9Q3BNF4_9BASI|nr:hypothetical protein [Austropuccinia psidii MF-1]